MASQKHLDVMSVIKQYNSFHPNAKQRFTKGDCYLYARMLKKAFPEAEIFSNNDHVITKIGERFYDATGLVEKGNAIPIESEEEKQFIERYPHAAW